MIHGIQGHDGSVTLGISALKYQMTVTMRKLLIRSNFRIEVSSKVACQLVSKAEVSQSAGLGDDGEGFSSRVT